MVDAVMGMINNGDALLSIAGTNPDLLGGLDPEIVGMMQTRHLNAASKISERVTTNAVNWCVVAAAGEEWAKKIFPDLSVEKAQEKLWQAIFETTRIDQPDPIAAWEKHILFLRERARYLQSKQFTALHYTSPGTAYPRPAQRTSVDQRSIDGTEWRCLHSRHANRRSIHLA